MVLETGPGAFGFYGFELVGTRNDYFSCSNSTTVTPAQVTGLTTSGGGNGVGRVCALPCHICGGAVGRRDFATEHAQNYSELRAMVGGMQDPAPEYPDALTLDVEEWNNLHPPGLRLRGEEFKPVEN